MYRPFHLQLVMSAAQVADCHLFKVETATEFVSRSVQIVR